MTDRAFAEVTSRLYAAAADAAEWPALMSRLAGLLRCEHALILARESWNGEITFWASAGLTPNDEARFRSDHAAEIGLPLFRAAPPGMACPRSAFLSDMQFERSPYYEEIVRPAGGFHSLNAVLTNSAYGAAIVAFCRSPRGPDFSPCDAAKLQRLLPHLDASLGLSVRLHRSERSARSLRALVDALDFGAILVDAGLQPHFINRRAMHALARSDGVRITSAGVALSTAAKTGELRALIAHAIGPASRAGCLPRRQRLSVPRSSCRPPWLLTVLPMPDEESGALSQVSLAAIFIQESAASGDVDTRLVGETFRLTGREAEVAALIAAGRDVRAVAGALGIGIGTVRTHLKHVFDKTGERNQLSLAVKLQAFAERG